MGPAQTALEAEFGPFNERRRLYYDDGYEGGSIVDKAAVERMQARFRVVSELLVSFDDTLDVPAAGHLEAAGYRMDEAPVPPGKRGNVLSHAKCFKLELAGECEDIIAWMAGYADASVTWTAPEQLELPLVSGDAPACRDARTGAWSGSGRRMGAVWRHGSEEAPCAPMPTLAEIAAYHGQRLVGVTRSTDARGVFTAPLKATGPALA